MDVIEMIAEPLEPILRRELHPPLAYSKMDKSDCQLLFCSNPIGLKRVNLHCNLFSKLSRIAQELFLKLRYNL